MAARNVTRNRRRTLLSTAAIGLCVAFVWISSALTIGMMQRTVDNATQGLLGHVQIHHPDYADDPRIHHTIPESLVHAIETADLGEPLTLAPRLYGQGYARVGGLGSGVMLVGVDPEREAKASELATKIEGGAYFGTTDFGATDDDALLVGDELARRLEITPGSEIELAVPSLDGSITPKKFVVVGTVATGMVEFNESAVFMRLPLAQELMGLPGQIHEISIRGGDASEADALARTLRPVVAAVEPQARVESWRELVPDMALFVDLAEGTFAMFAFVIVLVVGTAILLTQSMIVFERRRELGLLRAIGVRPGQLLQLLVLESSLLAVAGALLGLVVGGLVLLLLAQTGLDLGGGAEMEMAGVAMSPILFPAINVEVPTQAFVTTVGLAAFASLLAGARTALRGPKGILNDG